MALLDVQDTTAPSTDPVIVVWYVLFFMTRFYYYLFSSSFVSLDCVLLFDVFEFPVTTRKKEKAEMRRLNWEFISGNVTFHFEILTGPPPLFSIKKRITAVQGGSGNGKNVCGANIQ